MFWCEAATSITQISEAGDTHPQHLPGGETFIWKLPATLFLFEPECRGARNGLINFQFESEALYAEHRIGVENRQIDALKIRIYDISKKWVDGHFQIITPDPLSSNLVQSFKVSMHISLKPILSN